MKTMTLSNDIGSLMMVVVISNIIGFLGVLSHYGGILMQTIGALTTLFGFIFVIVRMIRFINTDFDGSPKKFIKEGFKLKKKRK